MARERAGPTRREAPQVGKPQRQRKNPRPSARRAWLDSEEGEPARISARAIYNRRGDGGRRVGRRRRRRRRGRAQRLLHHAHHFGHLRVVEAAQQAQPQRQRRVVQDFAPQCEVQRRLQLARHLAELARPGRARARVGGRNGAQVVREQPGAKHGHAARAEEQAEDPGGHKHGGRRGKGQRRPVKARDHQPKRRVQRDVHGARLERRRAELRRFAQALAQPPARVIQHVHGHAKGKEHQPVQERPHDPVGERLRRRDPAHAKARHALHCAGRRARGKAGKGAHGE